MRHNEQEGDVSSIFPFCGDDPRFQILLIQRLSLLREMV